jgi:hypothetical protein
MINPINVVGSTICIEKIVAGENIKREETSLKNKERVKKEHVKGTVQRKLRGVQNGINRKVLP